MTKPYAKFPPVWMKPLQKIPPNMSGSSSCDLYDCFSLAQEAWGLDKNDDGNSGLLAFAYLWRRFGPPIHGGDDHKSLCDYTLGTPHKEVFLWLHLSGAGLLYSTGCWITNRLEGKFREPQIAWEKKFERWWLRERCDDPKKPDGEAFYNDRCNQSVIKEATKMLGVHPRRANPLPHDGKWRKGPPVMRLVNNALLTAMKELLRPVFVRDCPLTILGVCADGDVPQYEGGEAPVSKYAGFGIPEEGMKVMDKWAKEARERNGGLKQ